jgi:predicted nucleic acid-binding protein
MAMIIVSDTSPLSNLAMIDHLFLLREIYQTVIIPLAVAQELENTREDDPRIAAVLSLDWIEVKKVSDLTFVKELQENRLLDRGESEAIALALELKAEELLIDERLGRREAARLGLSMTGVLGILLMAKRRGLIPVVRPVMDDLMTIARFRISRPLYEEVLVIAQESVADE